MKRLFFFSLALAAASTLSAAPLRALEHATSRTRAMAERLNGTVHALADAKSDELAALGAGTGFDSTAAGAGDMTVDGRGQGSAGGKALGSGRTQPGAGPDKQKEPPVPDGADTKFKLSDWGLYGGAAALGALQGFLTGGPLGALAGAAMGAAGAYFYKKGDYGTAFGMAGGAILGSALGGPIGGLIGAVVGGLLGHFLGKLID